jgi:hypothetical protein
VYILTVREVGPPVTPQEIKRLRRENMDLCRKMGQPVVYRHMWNEDDEEDGVAERCPACYDPAYDQSRDDCPVCFGFTFVSHEKAVNPNLYVTPDGLLADVAPGWDPDVDPPVAAPEGYVRAPRYGGFAESVLTWLVEPDVAVDVFRVMDTGTMVRTYEAVGVAPWFPGLADNDLCVEVELAPNDYSIVDSGDRFQLKMVQPITVRGFGKRGRPPGSRGKAFRVAQSFQMSRAPNNTNLYSVPLDVE